MTTREKIRKSLEGSIQENKPIIGVAVGSGLSAKQAVEGGADLILTLNAGLFRSSGVASTACMMPFTNSNEMVMKFGQQEVLPRIKEKPVVFGACATDPTVSQESLLDRIIKVGFQGVNNFPTVGLIDGAFRGYLEERSLGYQCEIDFMEKAVKRGLFTIAFVFDEVQAMKMSKVNVDVICVHLGWTIGGEVSVKQRISLEESAQKAKKIFDAASKVNKNIFKMVYGGMINDAEQADYIYHMTNAVGYIGGSSFERIPTEISIKETTESFKNFFTLKQENENLKKELLKKNTFDEIVGHSRSMQEIYGIVNKVANKNVNVLVYGESGTGKELVVRAIHYNSERYNEAFVKINCAAIPKTILESELFGHEKGAFTGATKQRLGRFELAHKGTLFLDEVGEMDLDIQAKLLRVIQQQEFERVGGNKTIKVDVRIICATNKDLRQEVQKGNFREDLYYRLNVISIYTPPLRQHKEDIPLLVNHFIKKNNEKFNLNIKKITPSVMDVFMHYDWPGNVRELEHTLEPATILCDGNCIELYDLPKVFHGLAKEVIDHNKQDLEVLDHKNRIYEKQLIASVLEQYSWNRTKAANHLGITRRTLYNKIKKYNLISKA